MGHLFQAERNSLCKSFKLSNNVLEAESIKEKRKIKNNG
jgi:hypothetical protein